MGRTKRFLGWWTAALLTGALPAGAQLGPTLATGTRDSTITTVAAADSTVVAQGKVESPSGEVDQLKRELAALGTSDPVRRVEVMGRLVQAYQALGMRRQAEPLLEQAVVEASQLAVPVTLGWLKGLRGDLLLDGGQVAASIAELEAAWPLVEHGDPRIAAGVANHLGNSHTAAGKWQEAERDYARALERAERVGDHGLMALVLLNRGESSRHAGEPQQAKRWLLQAAELAQRPDVALHNGVLLNGVGRLALRLVEATPDPELTALAQRSFSMVERGSGYAVRDRSFASGNLARLYERAGRAAEALTLINRAAFLAQEAGADDLLYQWQWRKGRLERELGDPAAAIGSYRLAVATLGPIRHDLIAAGRGERRKLSELVEPLVLELSDLLLQRARSGSDSRQRQDDLRQVVTAIEFMKSVALEEYFQDDCLGQRQEPGRKELQLPPRTATLHPLLLQDRLALVVGVGDGFELFEVAVARAAVREEVKQLRYFLEKRTTNQYLPHARRLYDWLIAPLEGVFAARGVTTLVVIPDVALGTIPFAALHDGKGFLVERLALATAPAMNSIETGRLDHERLQVVLAGLTEAVQGFSALPYVEKELSTINAEYAGSAVLLNQDFRLGKLGDELDTTGYPIVHIASHAQFKPDLNDTYVLTFDDKLTMNLLDRLVRRPEFQGQPVELLTLSACQTAQGDERAALGLAGVAIKAGARSALATLWFINDRSSAELVSRFYTQLKEPGISKAEALRQAQIALLRNRSFRHPAYWGPFMLIGNWL